MSRTFAAVRFGEPGAIMRNCVPTWAAVGCSVPRYVMSWLATACAVAAFTPSPAWIDGASPAESPAAFAIRAPRYAAAAEAATHAELSGVKIDRMHRPPFTLASQVRLNVHPVFGGLPSARTLYGRVGPATRAAWIRSRNQVKLAGVWKARL